MLTEVIVYIALFAILFSSVFVATIQTIDSIDYLQTKKNTVDNLYFFSSRLDSLVMSTPDWKTISLDTILQSIPDSGLSVDSFSSQISETATSSSRVLLLGFSINKNTYTFSYVQEK
jgi:predicted PurR-regulated permease PerM